jgi:hypothetical protein
MLIEGLRIQKRDNVVSFLRLRRQDTKRRLRISNYHLGIIML